MTAEGVHATFKVVGEKARTLERRGRLKLSVSRSSETTPTETGTSQAYRQALPRLAFSRTAMAGVVRCAVQLPT
jgi:hypothetical protein